MILAKLENGMLKASYCKVLYHGDKITVNPREEDFINAGYKPIEDNRMKEKEGYYQVPEYTEEEDKIIINYHYEKLEEEVDG